MPITKRWTHLGGGARTSLAATDGGVYRGSIIGETEDFREGALPETTRVAIIVSIFEWSKPGRRE